MTGVEFGVFVVPDASGREAVVDQVVRADRAGLDFVGIQDHPYQRRFLETFSLLAFLAARTSRIRLFPDVANLPLRRPAVLAKAAATIDLLSGGRFELGLGAGAFWEAIDDAARRAGRDPAQVRRVANVSPGNGFLDGPVEEQVEQLVGLVRELRFEAFVFPLGEDPARDIERLAGEVAPGVRSALGQS